MTDRTPAALAEQAAEAIRALNHATLSGTGYQWPSDIDRVVQDLAILAARLPQALEQASRWLETAHMAGRVGDDRATEDPRVTVTEACYALRAAMTRVERLYSALTEAGRHTNHLTGLGGDPE